MIKERKITRLFSFILGVLFIFGPIISIMIYDHQYQELMTAPINLLIKVIAIYFFSVIVGVLLIIVAKNGELPKWLQKYV